MKATPASCRHPGCPWKGSLLECREHEASCQFNIPVDCPNNCGQKIKKEEIKTHIHKLKGDCWVNPCSYDGCNAKNSREHRDGNIPEHMQMMNMELKSTVDRLETVSYDLKSELGGLDTRSKAADKKHEGQFNALRPVCNDSNTRVNMLEDKIKMLEGKADKEQMLEDKVKMLEGKVKMLEGKNGEQHGQLKRRDKEHALEIERLKEQMRSKLDEHNRRLKLICDNQSPLIIGLTRRHSWAVNVVGDEAAEGNTASSGERQISRRELILYTKQGGYKVLLRLYPNGKGSDFLSIALVLLPGDFDFNLKWPFPLSILLTLVGPEVGPQVEPIHSILGGLPGQEAFKRPSDGGPFFECMFPNMPNLEVFKKYVKDNKILIKIRIID